MTPLQRYQLDLHNRKIKTDDKQWQAVQCTQRVYTELLISDKNKNSFFSSIIKRKKNPVRGLYLWGGTGRGKTYLVDCF
ncbi:MAG: AFG1/ZapE family ATPase, partial [Gammaproteobacteria bacterium]|nr:AFG1/ZapE family ATPase [Gammaproteobacteria bacterium]